MPRPHHTALLAALLAAAALTAGCGSSSSSSGASATTGPTVSTSSTPATSQTGTSAATTPTGTTTAPTSSSTTPTSTTGTSTSPIPHPPANAVAACKHGVQSLPHLKQSTKARLETICEKADADPNARRKAAEEACRELVNASPLPAGKAKERALAACKHAGGANASK